MLLCEQIAALLPSVLLLQEVTVELQGYICGPLAQLGYTFTSAPRAAMPYYTQISSRYKMSSVKRVPFRTSTQYRDLLSCIITLPAGAGTCFVSTSHLESLGSGSLEREVQFNAALSQLHCDERVLGTKLRVFGGDCNLKPISGKIHQ